MMDSNDVIRQMMLGAELARFEFDGRFLLTFEHYGTDRHHEPAVVGVDLEAAAFLGGKCEWNDLLARFPVVTNEPSDPVLAAKFLELMWDGGPIVGASTAAGQLFLEWSDGTTLTVEAPQDFGTAWTIYDSVAPGKPWFWVVRGGYWGLESKWPGGSFRSS